MRCGRRRRHSLRLLAPWRGPRDQNLDGVDAGGTSRIGERYARIIRAGQDDIPEFAGDTTLDSHLFRPGTVSRSRNGEEVFTRHQTGDVNGFVQDAIALWREWFVVDRDVNGLREYTDSNRSGINENTALLAVAVAEGIEDDESSRRKERQCEDPKDETAKA